VNQIAGSPAESTLRAGRSSRAASGPTIGSSSQKSWSSATDAPPQALQRAVAVDHAFVALGLAVVEAVKEPSWRQLFGNADNDHCWARPSSMRPPF
jgi:hypothetical protein